MNDVYSVFGNAVRMKLILCLEQKTKNVSELIQTCGLSQSAVSQHLSKLKKFHLVKSEKIGKEVFYMLRYPKAAQISRLLIEFKKEVK